MNHTPGLWTVEVDHATEAAEFVRAHLDGESFDVASVLCDETGNANENARLIAAAPDLLAAVHGLLACCGPQHESEAAEMYRERMTLLQWHIDRASEALTKATGEA